MKYIVILSLIFPILAYAEPESQVHFAAHAGTSFALDTIAYGVNKHIGAPMPKTAAFVETMVIGLLYKYSEHTPTRGYIVPMSENIVGAGAATLTIVVFEF